MNTIRKTFKRMTFDLFYVICFFFKEIAIIYTLNVYIIKKKS